MAFVSYTARRGLAPGHSAGTVYVYLLPSIEVLDHSREVRIERQQSLSGAQEARYYHGKDRWFVQFEPIYGDEAALMLEFLKSTEDGQAFTFDPVGLPGTPSDYQRSVVRVDSGHQSARGMKRGMGGGNDPFAYSIEIREA